MAEKISFLSPICVKPHKKYVYHLCSEVQFTIGESKFTIYEGFETDLASISKILWPLYAPFHSNLMRCSIVHDFFYRNHIFTRKQCDLIFYNILTNDGIDKFRASIMYYGVRLFGWRFYKKRKIK